MPQGGLDKKALGAAGPLFGGCAAFLVALLLALPSSLCGHPPESGQEMEKVNPFQRFITIIPSPLMGEGGGGGEKSPSPNLVPEADPPWQASHQGLLSSCGATEGQGRGELNPTESDRELFQRVCTLCHGWAVENFLVAEGMVEGMEPICPPPFANWLPVVLTVATYQVKVQDKEETLPLIPRRDVLRVVEYLNENYPKEPICAKPWKKDIK